MFSANTLPSTAGCCTEKEEVKAASYKNHTYIQHLFPRSSLLQGFKNTSLKRAFSAHSVSGSPRRKVEAIVGCLPVLETPQAQGLAAPNMKVMVTKAKSSQPQALLTSKVLQADD